ncbi:S-adenosyl-L-methionine-dependent methyltransferase [Pholiota conissans]|uniref:Cytosine-specific methyltransferase n=1 Tax=Pholiota conissans TaxID=109636 RepID=A0A9P5YRE9_9AGAR|nr:S-adenosyl-L-methionine-dependent methyltransferase [Pholiota conissans]
MANPRLIPYVDIPYNADARRHLKQAYGSQPQPSFGPQPLQPRDGHLSPRKRRRLPERQSQEAVGIDSYSVKRLRASPTASDFKLESSRSRSPIPPDTQPSSLPESSKSENSNGSIEMPQMDELPSCTYTSTEDEIDEDEDLIVLGESSPAENDETIPIRTLDDFTIYDGGTLQLISVAELLQIHYSQRKYHASGIVRPWANSEHDASGIEDELDEDGDGNSEEATSRDRVTLSNILDFNLHAEDDGKYRVDPKMYIRTQFAWYILERPSGIFNPYFSPFWLQHHFLHLVVSASIEDPRITYTQFVDQLLDIDKKADFIVPSEAILDRKLRPEDLESDDVLAYIMVNLPDICMNIGIKISRVPLVRKILGDMYYDFDTAVSNPQVLSRSSASARQGATHANTSARATKTFLTPTVNHIAKDFFVGSLEASESAFVHDADGGLASAHHHKTHYSDPKQIIWGKRLQKHEAVYESAIIDGVIYSMGDIVMVAPDVKEISAPLSVNTYANQQFCQIRYFFEEKSPMGVVKKFHGLWFNHGSKTILQETSHSKALYLLDSCDDNLVTSVFKKCNVQIMQSGDDEVVDDRAHASNNFHCGLLYDSKTASFCDLPPNALAIDKGCKSCFACDLYQQSLDKKTIKHVTDGSLVIHGVIYHVNDYVYLTPSEYGSKLLDIGQIISISEVEVTIHFLGRYDDYVHQQKKLEAGKNQLLFDEKRLYFTHHKQAIPLHRLDGICYVQHFVHVQKVEKWTSDNDHYYLCQTGDINHLDFMQQKDFSFCELCYSKDHQRRKNAEKFSQSNSKLIGLELFSGAGGLGTGMNLSGFVETKYAVEISPSAAKTYVKNHSDTIVYCQDSSSLLKHAIIHSSNPEKTIPLLSLDGQTYCPPLPDKHAQVDFIFGGPPCQSFSHANHTKRQNDIRSTMPCNMLSYVEYYNPTYFLLENVAGFLSHRLYSTHQMESGAVVETEINMGMVKFVMRALIALGYQVCFKLLQAAQYGVPQSRRRVIFWGAKRGVPLPGFPIPMYAYVKGMHRVNLPTGDILEPPTRSKNPDVFHQYAPLQPITVNAAIGDLPKFDWINPHQILKKTKQMQHEDTHRCKKLKIPSFCAAFDESRKKISWNSLPGFPKGAMYNSMPQNLFQKWLRQDMEDGNGEVEVLGQYTMQFNSRVVEATCTVPLAPGACHRDLPQSLLPAYANKKKNRVFYGRMDGNGFFKCIVTQLSPLLKNQWPLHPSQKRIITVREAARCQGFPDNYEFESVDNRPAKIVEDQLKQIGNAVAVPFALALGKELGEAMILAWEKKQREGSILL